MGGFFSTIYSSKDRVGFLFWLLLYIQGLAPIPDNNNTTVSHGTLLSIMSFYGSCKSDIARLQLESFPIKKASYHL